VVSSLLAVLGAVQQSWGAVQADTAGLPSVFAGQGGQPATIDQLCPELCTGIATLNQAVNRADDASDVATFAVALSSVYEAGRTLIAALDGALSH
jgi:hypothetical protein